MLMSPRLRKFTYTTHITSSVAWIGAVIVFIAMAALALTSRDAATVRGAYLVMAPAAWFALVPLAHASLLTGIALSVGTTWGLIRHYWVVLKLGITVFCTVILMIYMGTFRQMAGIAADPFVDLEAVRNASPLLHATVALVLLLVTTVLGVYKPFGLTAYGRRITSQRGGPDIVGAGIPKRDSDSVRARGRFRGRSLEAYLVITVLALFVVLIVLHLIGGGAHRH
jgi:hypothetical protein